MFPRLAPLLLLALASCMSVRHDSTPADWPVTWEHRDLVRTTHAWAYASSDSAAADAEHAAASAAADYRAVTGRAAPDVLVIATDTGQQPPPLDGPDLATIAASQSQDDAAMTPEQRRAAQTALSELSICVPVALVQSDKAHLRTLPSRVQEGALVILLVPTRAAVTQSVKRILDASVKSSGMPLAARILAAPLLGWARSKMVDELCDAQRYTLLEALARADPSLSADERDRLSERASEPMRQAWSDLDLPPEVRVRLHDQAEQADQAHQPSTR